MRPSRFVARSGSAADGESHSPSAERVRRALQSRLAPLSVRSRSSGTAPGDRETNEVDLIPPILYPKGFALVDIRMIPAEPAVRPRAVDASGDRLMSLQAILDDNSVAVAGASRPGAGQSGLTAQRRPAGNRTGVISVGGGAAILLADRRVSDPCRVGTDVMSAYGGLEDA